jgi:hypothetical protein
MVDTNVLIRKWILSAASITSLLGTNANGSVYCGDLPEGFDPALGPAIQIVCSGGPVPHSEILSIVDERMQIRVWAGIEQYQLARQIYGAVRDLIHGATGITPAGQNGTVIRCLEVVPGQNITDPDTGWATVLAFYQLMAR